MLIYRKVKQRILNLFRNKLYKGVNLIKKYKVFSVMTDLDNYQNYVCRRSVGAKCCRN